MKAFFLGLLVVIPLVGSLAEQAGSYRDFVAPDTEQMDLLGPVKNIRTVSYDLEAGKPQISGEESETFDPQGYLLEEHSLDHDSKEESRTRYSYDAAGNLTEEIELKGSRTMTKKVRLFPERQRSEKTIVSVGRTVTLEESKYDSFKKESEGTNYQENGQVDYRYKARRDKAGKEIEVTFSDASGKPTSITTSEWDARGFIIKETTDDRVEKYLVLTTYEYPQVDLHGNWTEQLSNVTVRTKGRKDMSWKDRSVRTVEYH